MYHYPPPFGQRTTYKLAILDEQIITIDLSHKSCGKKRLARYLLWVNNHSQFNKHVLRYYIPLG